MQAKGQKVVSRRSLGLPPQPTNRGDVVRRLTQRLRPGQRLVAVWVDLAIAVGMCVTTLVEVDRGALPWKLYF